jgi:hypothetical protein
MPLEEFSITKAISGISVYGKLSDSYGVDARLVSEIGCWRDRLATRIPLLA